MSGTNLARLLDQARNCNVCQAHLPLEPRPLLAVAPPARIVLIGQAPGRKAHESGVPWQDRSGDRLREWLGVQRDAFYHPALFALLPMGFCYPGSGKGGDLPPRKECAPLWHPQLLPEMPDLKLTVYLGRHAAMNYLGQRFGGLSEAVEAYQELLPQTIALPHPSPRNAMWAAKRPWFSDALLPQLQRRVRRCLR